MFGANQLLTYLWDTMNSKAVNPEAFGSERKQIWTEGFKPIPLFVFYCVNLLVFLTVIGLDVLPINSGAIVFMQMIGTLGLLFDTYCKDVEYIKHSCSFILIVLEICRNTFWFDWRTRLIRKSKINILNPKNICFLKVYK